MEKLTIDVFVGMLEAYYGRMQALHRSTLLAWLSSKNFSTHYLETLYQGIVTSYSTKYGKPCDLAIVKEVHDSISPSYVPPAALIDTGQKMIGERYVDPEEGEQFIADLIAKLARKRRAHIYKKSGGFGGIA